jgi:hypothetical protein
MELDLPLTKNPFDEPRHQLAKLQRTVDARLVTMQAWRGDMEKVKATSLARVTASRQTLAKTAEAALGYRPTRR